MWFAPAVCDFSALRRSPPRGTPYICADAIASGVKAASARLAFGGPNSGGSTLKDDFFATLLAHVQDSADGGADDDAAAAPVALDFISHHAKARWA